MNLLRYIILILLMCNIPGILLFNYGESMGSMFSYLTYVLLLLYYFINKKHQPPWPFLIFATTFFVISGLVDSPDEKYYLFEFVKYIIVIICGAELARKTTIDELFVLLIICGSSILIHATIYPNDYGRYSGFYIDPNSASFACLLGIALSFGIKNGLLKHIGLLFLTFCGIMTFSRTFLLMWAVLVLISSIQNKKNLKILGFGFGLMLLFLSISSLLQLDNNRLLIIENLFNKGVVIDSAKEDSRTETWSLYYNKIYDSPIFGNGYKSFTSDFIHAEGVHNNYLRIIGEAGFIPFLLFVGIYSFILIKSLQTFNTKPYQLLLAISIIALDLTNHNFDTLTHVIFVSLWLYFRVLENKVEDEVVE